MCTLHVKVKQYETKTRARKMSTVKQIRREKLEQSKTNIEKRQDKEWKKIEKEKGQRKEKKREMRRDVGQGQSQAQRITGLRPEADTST